MEIIAGTGTIGIEIMEQASLPVDDERLGLAFLRLILRAQRPEVKTERRSAPRFGIPKAQRPEVRDPEVLHPELRDPLFSRLRTTRMIRRDQYIALASVINVTHNRIT